MNLNKNIYRILIISVFIVFAFAIDAYCVEDTTTVRMKIVEGGTKWTNISVSESYKECEDLNSTSSTLGTSALEAHLTTDYDWSIMAIFSVSQYGATTRNSPGSTSTTKNKSGIYDIGTRGIHTTTLLNTSTSTSNEWIYGLYDENGNPKKYVNKINPTTGEDQNGRVSILYLSNEGTAHWLGAAAISKTNEYFPVGIKLGLFGFDIGSNSNNGPHGGQHSKTTFRPVIWN